MSSRSLRFHTVAALTYRCVKSPDRYLTIGMVVRCLPTAGRSVPGMACPRLGRRIRCRTLVDRPPRIEWRAIFLLVSFGPVTAASTAVTLRRWASHFERLPRSVLSGSSSKSTRTDAHVSMFPQHGGLPRER